MTLTNEMIAALEAKGFNRWTKGSMDRLYINAAQLGLVCDYYNTGNIRKAIFNGDQVSNSEGYRMKAAKTFIDIATGELFGTNKYLKDAAEEIIASVLN